MKIDNECCCECNTHKINIVKDNCPVCNTEGISKYPLQEIIQ